MTKNADRNIGNDGKQFTADSLSAIDLFSGCGGLTLGLEMAGFKVLAAIEIDHANVNTYKENHRDVLVLEEDIRSINPKQLMAKLGLVQGQLDLLAGCPPCQGFSTLRTLNGSVEVNDPRNELLAEFQHYVEVFLPKAVMMENVPGLASDERFTCFSRSLKHLGYVGKYRILDVADYGVPQRRRRLMYLAGKGMAIHFGRRRKHQPTVFDALSGLPKAGESGDPPHDIPERRSARVKEIIANIPKDGGSRSALPKGLQLPCHTRCNGFRDIYGRLSWSKVAPTITSGCFNPSKGRFLHPVEDRAITIREAALLQGFPQTYHLDPIIGKEALAAMIGNALPPPFVAVHGRRVLRMLKQVLAGVQAEKGSRSLHELRL